MLLILLSLWVYIRNKLPPTKKVLKELAYLGTSEEPAHRSDLRKLNHVKNGIKKELEKTYPSQRRYYGYLFNLRLDIKEVEISPYDEWRYLPDTEFFCRFRVLERHLGELNVIVPHAVVHAVVAQQVARQRIANAGGLHDDGERLRIFRPREVLAGVVDQQDVRAFLVHRPLEFHTRSLFDLFFQELYVVEERHRRHAGARSRPHPP